MITAVRFTRGVRDVFRKEKKGEEKMSDNTSLMDQYINLCQLRKGASKLKDYFLRFGADTGLNTADLLRVVNNLDRCMQLAGWTMNVLKQKCPEVTGAKSKAEDARQNDNQFNSVGDALAEALKTTKEDNG